MINKVMLAGNLTRDAELRHTNSGFPILELGIAVNERRKNSQSGEWEDRPNYFNMKMLGERGEKIAQYLTKGKKVAVVGRLEYRAWESKEGDKRSAVEVVIDDIEFMSAPGEGGGGGYQRPERENPAPAPTYGKSPADDLGGIDVNDEEIPF